MLTQKEAWLEIAHEFDNPKPALLAWCAESCHGSLGICSAITNLIYYGRISADDGEAMRGWVGLLPDCDWGGMGGYKWPLTLDGAKQRAEFCREQARKLSEGETTNG